jgi:hypothetical protein
MKRAVALMLLSMAIILGVVIVALSPPDARWFRGVCVGMIAVVAFAIWRGTEA